MSVPESGWLEYQRNRWMKHDACRWVRQDAARWAPPNADRSVFAIATSLQQPATKAYRAHELDATLICRARWHAAALRFQFALLDHQSQKWIKAGFDPNQPRAPKGGPDGGRWIGGADDPAGSIDEQQETATNEQLEQPPDIPDVAPATARLRNVIIKEAAYWLAKAAVREIAGGPLVGTFLNALDAAIWIRDGLPYIRAYLDPPKSLEELQQAALTPRRGYDKHHIVERSAAYKDGFSKDVVESGENFALIPTLKHWDVNRWFETRHEDYAGLTPRQYLRSQEWEVRRQIGLRALVETGVLRP
jgi:hypothetical protein